MKILSSISPKIPFKNPSQIAVGVLGAVLAAGCVAGFVSVRGYNKQLADAALKEAQWKTKVQTLEQVASQEKANREALEAEQEKLRRTMSAREESYQKAIRAVQQPKSAEEVQQDAATYLGYKPAIANCEAEDIRDCAVEAPRLVFTLPATQQLIAWKLEADSAKASNTDLKQLLEDEQKKTSSLSLELSTTKSTLAETITLKDTYKKLATKNKKQKFFEGATKVLIGVGGFYIGKQVGH